MDEWQIKLSFPRRSFFKQADYLHMSNRKKILAGRLGRRNIWIDAFA